MMRFLLPILYVVLAGVVFFMLTQPLLTEINDLRAYKMTLTEGIKNAQAVNARIDELLSDRNQIDPSNSGELERLNKFIPSTVDNVRLIIDINRLATNEGMTLKDITLDTAPTGTVQPSARGTSTKTSLPATQNGIQSVTLGFGVSGSYRAFKAFLGELTRSLRVVDVQVLSFPSDKELDFYEYRVEVKTYWLQQN